MDKNDGQGSEVEAHGKRRKRKPDPYREQLDTIAWKVLADLLTPSGAFAGYSQDGLERVIQMRIAQEAERAGISAVDLYQAFQRAMEEFTGPKRASGE